MELLWCLHFGGSEEHSHVPALPDHPRGGYRTLPPYLMVRPFRGRGHPWDPSIQAIMAPIRTSRRGMSAFGGKADVNQGVAECPLLAISGHSSAPWRSKITPSDGCGRDAVPLAVERGTISLNLGVIWEMSDYEPFGNPPLLRLLQQPRFKREMSD